LAPNYGFMTAMTKVVAAASEKAQGSLK